jgi:hypothetical protein
MTKSPSRHESPASDTTRWVAHDYAVLRVVPHVYVGAFVPVGVMVHARTEEYLAIRTIVDPALLRARTAGVDLDLLERYLNMYRAVCAGDASAGPVALAPTSERFHWLTAPRSDVLQSSPVHEGLSADPRTALDQLYERFVEVPEESRSDRQR